MLQVQPHCRFRPRREPDRLNAPRSAGRAGMFSICGVDLVPAPLRRRIGIAVAGISTPGGFEKRRMALRLCGFSQFGSLDFEPRFMRSFRDCNSLVRTLDKRESRKVALPRFQSCALGRTERRHLPIAFFEFRRNPGHQLFCLNSDDSNFEDSLCRRPIPETGRGTAEI
jgi:hypothetical protein